MVLRKPSQLPLSLSTHSERTGRLTRWFVSLLMSMPSFASISNLTPRLWISPMSSFRMTAWNRKSAIALEKASCGTELVMLASHGPSGPHWPAASGAALGAGVVGATERFSSGDGCRLGWRACLPLMCGPECGTGR